MSLSSKTADAAHNLADTHLTDKEIKALALKANAIRITLIEALIEAGSGHTAGPLGMADIFTYLYFHELRHDPKNPAWPERDRLVLSNGHICPVLYSTMCHAGYASVEEYKKTLRKFGTKFQGHPHREYFPALETSSGPLGSGLSQATGMALAERIDSGRSYKKWVYALLSDGEMDCGNTWEGAMLAGKEKLGNLIAIVDRNNIQIDGFTEDVMPLEPLSDKWRSFNWHVIEVNGHDFADIHRAVGEAKAEFDKPSVLIANTIPGKGVPDFERKYEWHGKPPNKEEGAMALEELRTLGGEIKSEHQ
ncbi:MAG TPA: transketolase [Candidatus Paceibacterota bacterium]